MGILDYIRSRMEDGDPEFDLDWEIAREMANDRAESRFAAKKPTLSASVGNANLSMTKRSTGTGESVASGKSISQNAASSQVKPSYAIRPRRGSSNENYRTDAERVQDAKDSVKAAGGRKKDGTVVVDMDGSDVVVSSSGIKHRGKKSHRENDMLYPVLGEVLKNAIPVNELAPRSGEKKDSLVNNTFVFLGAFAYKNEICPVRIQGVQKNRTKKLDSIDVLKSLNTKIGKIDAPDKSDLTREAPSALAEISIANLIDIAQPLYPGILNGW